MSGSPQVLSKFFTEPAGGEFDTSSERWPFKSSSTLGKIGSIVESDNTLGTRQRRVENTREGTYEVRGTLVIDVSPAWLDKWLPRILGANESNDSFATAETLPEFDMLVDRVGGTFTFFDCKVAKATFRGREGQPIECTLDVIGKSAGTGDNAPAVALGTAAIDYPYMFYEGAMSLLSASRAIKDFEFSIDNQINTNFYNSISATDLVETGRIVMLSSRTKFTSTEMSALYDKGAGGASAVLTVTGVGPAAGFVWTTTFGRFQPTAQPPAGDGGEYFLPLNGQCRAVSTTPDILMTNDVTA